MRRVRIPHRHHGLGGIEIRLYTSGFAPNRIPAHKVSVYLDGKLLKNCIEADDVEGYAVCYKGRNDKGVVLTEKYYGKIEFVNKGVVSTVSKDNISLTASASNVENSSEHLLSIIKDIDSKLFGFGPVAPEGANSSSVEEPKRGVSEYIEGAQMVLQQAIRLLEDLEGRIG